MSKQSSQQLKNYLPVIVFIVSFFLFEMTDWLQATKFTVALIFSQIAFMVMASLLKENHVVGPADVRRLNFLTGLLTLILIGIIVITWLHWQSIMPYFWRMLLLIVAVVVYFTVQFRGLRVLQEIRLTAPEKKE